MNIAFLTAGGIAPCLSSSIGHLIDEYLKSTKNCNMIGYLNGYKGLLLGNSIVFNKSIKSKVSILNNFGGSPIGNSRIKLTNIQDCIDKSYIKDGENPLEVAAKQLVKDKIDILHTIGGDDTNTTASDLVLFLKKKGYDLIVIGLPKTIDNDIIPISQSLGAWTAAEQGARFFENISNENTTSSRSLIIHEIMGRNCGWLTAFTTYIYQKRLDKKNFLPDALISKEKWGVDAVYIPEIPIDLDLEIIRLKKVMDKNDCVNIFLSEGAGIGTIIKDMESNGKEIKRDAFGHIRLDEINSGEWYGEKFGKKLEADKVLVQKSGYFARSSPPNSKDLELISKSAKYAVKCALNGQSGVIGLDENRNNKLSCIDFNRIRGGKKFNINESWFKSLLIDIKQK